jgi:hypothetical protein
MTTMIFILAAVHLSAFNAADYVAWTARQRGARQGGAREPGSFP